MAPPSKDNSTTTPTDNPGAKRREQRVAQPGPTPADVAAEAAAIYPDTFASPPTPEEIASEAYEIYIARGGEHGRDREDWYEAERRISERRQRR